MLNENSLRVWLTNHLCFNTRDRMSISDVVLRMLQCFYSVGPNQPVYVWLTSEKTNTTGALQLFYLLLRSTFSRSIVTQSTDQQCTVRFSQIINDESNSMDHLLTCKNEKHSPDTQRKSSMDVMSSTASVRTRTCFSHCSLNKSILSWATLLLGLAARANAALITCNHPITAIKAPLQHSPQPQH